jgi:hypothetical protein
MGGGPMVVLAGSVTGLVLASIVLLVLGRRRRVGEGGSARRNEARHRGRLPRVRLYLRAVLGRSPRSRPPTRPDPPTMEPLVGGPPSPTPPLHVGGPLGATVAIDDRDGQGAYRGIAGTVAISEAAPAAPPVALEVTPPLTSAPPTWGPGGNLAPRPAPQSAEPAVAVVVADLGPRQEVATGGAGEPVVFGAGPDATVSVAGEPRQAAVVWSDGAALLTRLGSGPVHLGELEVGAVGVPITASNHVLLLPHAWIDLGRFVSSSPRPPISVDWTRERRAMAVSHGPQLAAAALGEQSGRALAIASGCFAGVGRRAAAWAVEAAVERCPSTAVFVIGTTFVGDGLRWVVAASGFDLRVRTGRSGETIQSIEVVTEPSGLVTADLPCEEAVRIRVALPSGVRAGTCTLRVDEEDDGAMKPA